MKRLITIIFMLLIFTGISFSENAIINTVSTGTIAASGTYTSFSIDVSKLEGYFSVQSVLTGTGTAKIELQTSHDNTTWITWATDIVTAQTVGSNIYSYEPPLSKYQRLLITETGGANSVSLEIKWAVK